jgi:hypothetical protein
VENELEKLSVKESSKEEKWSNRTCLRQMNKHDDDCCLLLSLY